METTKFTKGPWRTKQLGHTQYRSIDANEWEYLARVSAPLDGEKEGIANANLIAAAPDLYQVLHDIATAHGPGTLASDELFERMNTALSKAEGLGE